MPIKINSILRILLVLAFIQIPGACTKSPEINQVKEIVQQQLTDAFDDNALVLKSFRRMGSASLSAVDTGKVLRIVYYNATLTFQRDYSFSDWNSLGVASFASLMGATPSGVKGVVQEGNRKGDTLYLHGTVTFVLEGERWMPVAYVPSRVGVSQATVKPSGVMQKYYIDEINLLMTRETKDAQQQAEIIEEELKKSYTSMQQRLGRLGRALIIASGVGNGEYAKLVEILVDSLRNKGETVIQLNTQGSLENLQLLREGKADLALVQNDIAKMSGLGTGIFQSIGPDYSLRALASLFPEAIHIVVNKNSAISVVEDLRGKRVDLGKPNSGSKINSLSLLQAADIKLSDLRSVTEDGLKEGLDKLLKGELDAVIATINVPANALQIAAANGNIRFLSIPAKVSAKLLAEGDEFIHYNFSPYTYPGQKKKVSTVAVTAMLVASESLANKDVQLVLTELFENIDFAVTGGSSGSNINREKATQAITLPMHEAAIKYFSESRVLNSADSTR